MATTTLDELIERTRLKANVLRSNFATDLEIVGYLNEARKQFRELVITADDSYYQSTLDFSIGGMPLNVQALPSTFWKMRGLDAFAGDSLRQREVFAREFRNRFDPGVGYYFGGDGNSIVLSGQSPEQGNPFRLYYTPKPLPLAQLVAVTARDIPLDPGDDTSSGAGALHFDQYTGFSAADVGGVLTIVGGAEAGAYTILAVTAPGDVTVFPAPTVAVFGGVTSVTVTAYISHARTFAIANPDSQQNGNWLLQNGTFGEGDVGAYLTVAINAPNASLTGSYQIAQVLSATIVRATPAVLGTFAPIVGTASISRQPPGTEQSLDLTEDNFSEYFSVRAAMVIARKKRQDTLVAQLGAERAAIEDRIAALSRMRQSEPQQAPVLWGRRSISYDDWEV